MARYSYAIAVGSDQTALVNVENILPIAPKGQIMPLGSVRRTTLDQRVQSNGTKVFTWSFAAMSFADFEAWILFVFGDWDTESSEVTLDTRFPDENLHRGNATAIRPVEGADYQRREYGAVEDFVQTFRGFEELSDSEFSTEFSLEFTA